MPPLIQVVRSFLLVFLAAISQRRGGLCSRWILTNRLKDVLYRVLLYLNRRLKPLLYNFNVKSSLDLFNHSRLGLFYQSSHNPSSQSSVTSSVNPSNQTNIKSYLNLFCQSSVTSCLEFLNLSHPFSLESSVQFSLKSRASSRLNNGDIYRGLIQLWRR